MSIATQLLEIKSSVPSNVTLVAVSKTKPASAIQEAYNAGQRTFGENKVQELCEKHEVLPKDIEWHMIGHLQSNKVKYLAPFVALIHGVDSKKLLKEINKQGKKINRKIPVLLQVFIAQEDTKFGFDLEELTALLSSDEFNAFSHVEIHGLMGMASHTEDKKQIEKEFSGLTALFNELKSSFFAAEQQFSQISMGMSGDYPIAIEQGSSMIRVGSAIFGARNYPV